MKTADNSLPHHTRGACTSGQTASPAIGLILIEARRKAPASPLRRLEAGPAEPLSALRLLLTDGDGIHGRTVTARRIGMAVPVSQALTMDRLGVPDTHVTADIDRCREPRLLTCADALHGEWRAHRPGARQFAESLLTRNPGSSLVVLRSGLGRSWLLVDRTCSRRLVFSRPRHAGLSAQKAPLFVACLQSWLSSGHPLRDLASVTETGGPAG